VFARAMLACSQWCVVGCLPRPCLRAHSGVWWVRLPGPCLHAHSGVWWGVCQGHACMLTVVCGGVFARAMLACLQRRPTCWAWSQSCGKQILGAEAASFVPLPHRAACTEAAHMPPPACMRTPTLTIQGASKAQRLHLHAQCFCAAQHSRCFCAPARSLFLAQPSTPSAFAHLRAQRPRVCQWAIHTWTSLLKADQDGVQGVFGHAGTGQLKGLVPGPEAGLWVGHVLAVKEVLPASTTDTTQPVAQGPPRRA